MGAICQADDAEMPRIEGSDTRLPVTFSHGYHARVDLIEGKIRIRPAENGHAAMVGGSEVEHLHLALRDAVEEANLRVSTESAESEEGRFGDNRRGCR